MALAMNVISPVGMRATLGSRSGHCFVVRPAQTRRVSVVRAEKVDQGDQLFQKPERTDDISGVEAGNISPEKAERRADIGKERTPEFFEAAAFDGPGPETNNGRLAMLGVVTGLAAEFGSGIGLREQVAAAPFSILATFIIISLATYVPVLRGFTRKEPYATGPFTPQAENTNGRLAMVGWTAMLLTEAIAGKSTIDFWGLPHGSIPFHGLF